MPFRNFYLPDSGDCLDLRITGELDSPQEDWEDLLRWDGIVEAPISEQKYMFKPTLSTPSKWDLENPTPEFPVSLLPDFQFPFEDPLLDMEDSQCIQPSPEDLPFPLAYEFEQPAPQFTPLTQAEEQSLQNIAMPYLFSQTRISSAPPSPTPSHSTSASPSPEPQICTRKPPKRKAALLSQDLPGTCQSRKRGHNAIEKRYRTNLNDKINCLREGIPPLCKAPSDAISDETGEEADDSEAKGEGVDKKYGKAAILTRALEYIRHLEGTTRRMGEEVMGLKTRVGVFERLAMSGSVMANIGAVAPPDHQLDVKCETLGGIQAGKPLLLGMNFSES